jgi:DNA-binding winged helix-turn-helix (wHTH) protein
MSVLDLIPQTEKETLKFRLLAIMAVALASLFNAGEVPIVPTLVLVVGYLTYSYILRTFLIPRFTSYLLLMVMLLVDVGAIISALYIIGLDSPIFGLLPIVVVYYAMYLGYTGGIAAATASTLGYTSLVFATGDAGEMKNLLAIQPFFYIVALLVGYMTQQRFRETQQRQALQQLITAEANAKVLLELAQALNRVIDPATVSHDLARMASLVTQAPVCLIFAHDAKNNALVYEASNLSEKLKDGKRPMEAIDGPSFLSDAWNQGKVTSLNGLGEGRERPTWLARLDAQQALACPITSGGRKIGVVCAVASSDSPTLDEEAAKGLVAFAEVAGRFLATTQLYSQAESRSRRVAVELQQNIEKAGRFRDLAQRRSLRFGHLIVEPSRESVRWQDSVVRLTKTEFDLLYMLAEKSGSVINQETLVREVWGPDYVPQGKVVDVTIHRLRRKLAGLPDGRRLIRTVRGQGYTFAPPERFVNPQ